MVLTSVWKNNRETLAPRHDEAPMYKGWGGGDPVGVPALPSAPSPSSVEKKRPKKERRGSAPVIGVFKSVVENGFFIL